MTTESKPVLTLEEKANILRENGVNVVNCFEQGDQFFRRPTIQFGGDDHEGERAANIMIEHGINIYSLYRTWIYGLGNKSPIGVCWMLDFYRSR